MAVVWLGIEAGFGSDLGFATALRGIEQSLAQSHHTVVLATIPAAEYMRGCLFDRELDGIIIRGPGMDLPGPDRGASLLAALGKLPRVWIIERVKNATGDLCCCDPDAVGRRAAEHLCSMGHRRLAYLDPRAGPIETGAMRHAFTTHAVACGCTVRHFEAPRRPATRPVLVGASPAEVDALVACWAAGAKSARASALFVPSAAAVVNLYYALGRRGLQIPRDVSVLCASDCELALADLDPTVSVIDMNMELVGSRAADRLVSCLTDAASGPAARVLIEPTLVPRASVAKVGH